MTLVGFDLGPIYINTWGMTAALGFLLAIKLATNRFKTLKEKNEAPELSQIKEKNLLDFSFNLILAILLGSRILFIFEEWPIFAEDLGAVFRIWEGGFSFFGGAAGALSYGLWWSKKNKISPLLLGEIFTPAWIFGLAVGRFGCFLIHDHLGKPTNLPWAMWIERAYRHEPALYEMFFLLCLGLIIRFREKVNGRNKNIFLISLVSYAFGRFWIDFVRAEAIAGGDPRWLDLTLAQWISLIILISGFFFYFKNRKKLAFSEK